jgi:hypothetical protein
MLRQHLQCCQRRANVCFGACQQQQCRVAGGSECSSGPQHGRVHALVGWQHAAVPDTALLRPQQAVIGAREGPIV